MCPPVFSTLRQGQRCPFTQTLETEELVSGCRPVSGHAASLFTGAEEAMLAECLLPVTEVPKALSLASLLCCVNLGTGSVMCMYDNMYETPSSGCTGDRSCFPQQNLVMQAHLPPTPVDRGLSRRSGMPPANKSDSLPPLGSSV